MVAPVKRKRRLSPEEFRRRKVEFRDYVISHPDLTWREIWSNKDVANLLYPYRGKVERGIYNSVSDGQNLRDVPVEDFRALASYIASKEIERFRRADISIPDIEDLRQEGMIGVLKARDKLDENRNVFECGRYTSMLIRRQIRGSLRNYFGPVSLPQNCAIRKLTFLCRYGFSAQEMREKRGDEFFEGRSETIDAQARLLNAKNLGLGILESSPDLSEDLRSDEVSYIVQDLLRNALDDSLSKREKSILCSILSGKTLEDVGNNQDKPITKQRVEQIKIRALGKLRRHIRDLVLTDDPNGTYLYNSYFYK